MHALKLWWWNRRLARLEIRARDVQGELLWLDREAARVRGILTQLELNK